MEEIIALLLKYDSEYCDKIKGYPDFLLDELEEVFGRPLPNFYKLFAMEMGENAGPLLSRVRSYDPLLDVADLYRVCPKEELPSNRFLFIFGDIDPLAPYHYWLDLDTITEDGDCEVVRMPFGADKWGSDSFFRHSSSLKELLLTWAKEYTKTLN